MLRQFTLITCLALYLSACSPPAPDATLTPTFITLPTFTPAPPPTPSATATQEPYRTTLRIKDKPVNCRYGPGVVFETINEIQPAETARVIGRNDTSTWWYVRDPGNPDGLCWISSDVSELEGEAEKLPIQAAPFITITNVNLRVEPTRLVVPCDNFPQTVFFEAELYSTGPTYFSWRWELSTGVTSNDGLMAFEQFGTIVLREYYQISAPGEYWVNLHILEPNEIVEQVAFPVSCYQ